MLALSFCLPQFAAASETCIRIQEEPFAGEVVRKAHLKSGQSPLAIFSAPLAVNTDGAPTSYHPADEKGKTDAINRIDNGIAIYVRATHEKVPVDTEWFFEVYRQWRAAGFPKRLNDEYQINWESVLAPRPDGNGPCILESGYFGSLTALKNGLKGDARGDCQSADQLDQRYIPAIVLRGSANPLKTYGAAKGDLVVAINPITNVTVAAIIGDTGDGKRIGEGSVALNLALLGKSDVPTTYAAAKKLDTGTKSMIVVVLPGSATFELARPYTADNIAARVDGWLRKHEYGPLSSFADIARTCATGL